MTARPRVGHVHHGRPGAPGSRPELLPANQVDAVLGTYADAQLSGPKVPLLATAAIGVLSVLLTRPPTSC